ncbi:hypothetical protein [Olivibacter jilunii]|uniref:hypothetical protein n=1 Tax=Olivibacter jilunii TaxID=985016 RepID=UPI00102FFC3E|nr:hypothetical protein [Olivibacter jilunii]
MIVPPEKPRLSARDLKLMIEPYNIDRNIYPLVIVGIRGYYLRSMGDPNKNDRGIYDDAIFVDSPNVTASFNANTDPSKIRKGVGYNKGKGMAMLKRGAWKSYQFGKHKSYQALIQTGGNVTVVRDGSPDYEDTGFFGINIHKGSYSSTSSEGCQTIYPNQWDGFISLVKSEAIRCFGEENKNLIIPYVLVESK